MNPKTVGEDADQVRGHRLHVPARAQARGHQLCIVQAVYHSGDLAPLVRDSGEDVLMIDSHQQHSRAEQIFGSIRGNDRLAGAISASRSAYAAKIRSEDRTESPLRLGGAGASADPTPRFQRCLPNSVAGRAVAGRAMLM